MQTINSPKKLKNILIIYLARFMPDQPATGTVVMQQPQQAMVPASGQVQTGVNPGQPPAGSPPQG